MYIVPCARKKANPALMMGYRAFVSMKNALSMVGGTQQRPITMTTKQRRNKLELAAKDIIKPEKWSVEENRLMMFLYDFDDFTYAQIADKVNAKYKNNRSRCAVAGRISREVEKQEEWEKKQGLDIVEHANGDVDIKAPADFVGDVKGDGTLDISVDENGKLDFKDV